MKPDSEEEKLLELFKNPNFRTDLQKLKDIYRIPTILEDLRRALEKGKRVRIKPCLDRLILFDYQQGLFSIQSEGVGDYNFHQFKLGTCPDLWVTEEDLDNLESNLPTLVVNQVSLGTLDISDKISEARVLSRNLTDTHSGLQDCYNAYRNCPVNQLFSTKILSHTFLLFCFRGIIIRGDNNTLLSFKREMDYLSSVEGFTETKEFLKRITLEESAPSAYSRFAILRNIWMIINRTVPCGPTRLFRHLKLLQVWGPYAIQSAISDLFKLVW